MDMDYVDGYEELPHEFQEKVYRALDQGHVDMEDWKGDPEYNVPGKSGTGPRKTKKKKEEEVFLQPSHIHAPPADYSYRPPQPPKLQMGMPLVLPPLNPLPRSAVARRPTPTTKRLRLPHLRRPEERRQSRMRTLTPRRPTSSPLLRRRPPRARRPSRLRRLPTSTTP